MQVAEYLRCIFRKHVQGMDSLSEPIHRTREFSTNVSTASFQLIGRYPIFISEIKINLYTDIPLILYSSLPTLLYNASRFRIHRLFVVYD